MLIAGLEYSSYMYRISIHRTLQCILRIVQIDIRIIDYNIVNFHKLKHLFAS